MTDLKLTPVAQLGWKNDDDHAPEELPAREGYAIVDSCGACEASAATVAVLRAEVARLRSAIRDHSCAHCPDCCDSHLPDPNADELMRAADATPLAKRAKVLEDDENGEESAPHTHDLSRTGSIIGSTVLRPPETWPANFEEDPDCEGCGTYTHCELCAEAE